MRRHLVIGLLLGCGLGHPARADIYARTEGDGSVSLTNLPTDAGYTLLVAAPAPTAPPTTTPVKAARPEPPVGRARYEQVVAEVSQRHGLDSALLHAVISVESGYNPRAVSRKGATGLMQLMPQTAQRYGVADALDPRQNLEGGARYLRDLLRRFDNDLRLALAAYNAGEQAVRRHGNRIPPYRETQAYVPQVLAHYQRNRDAP